VDPLQGLLLDFRRDRSAAAMEEIVRATRPRLLAVARRIGSRDDAEDSVQAAYHALLARPEAGTVAVLPWLMAAVVRIAYRRKALARREIRIAERLARPASPVEEASRREIAALVRREVARLPARYRDPVVLFYLECLSVTEVGRLLDVPASTVTTQLQRARLLLRARLSPALLHSVMVVPWFLADCGKALAVPVGGVMKAKTAILVVGIAAATGAVGLGAGLVHRDEPDVRSIARAEPPMPNRDEEVEELRSRLAELEATKGGPGGAARADANSSPSNPQGSVARQETAAAWPDAFAQLLKKHELDLEKSKAAAAKLGVSDDQLVVAYKAYLCLANRADPAAQKEALNALAALGVDRTAAVVALLRGVEGGPTGTEWLNRLLATAHVEGQEHHIVDLLKDATSPPWIKGAIVDNADAVDSAVVRDYLLERLGREEDHYMFASLAMSLGKMREPRAVAACAEALRKGGDWEPFEVYALAGLQCGGSEAETALLAYVDSPNRRYLADGIRILAGVNALQARARAEAILADPARKLADRDREILLEVAGRTAR
jgi:RNA polymerase sigma factor (sigma-70 family)